MKPKRVECDKCTNFVPLVLIDDNDYMLPIKSKAMCRLGKRVMFRMPTNLHQDDSGYFRYCNDFKPTNEAIHKTIL